MTFHFLELERNSLNHQFRRGGNGSGVTAFFGMTQARNTLLQNQFSGIADIDPMHTINMMFHQIVDAMIVT